MNSRINNKNCKLFSGRDKLKKANAQKIYANAQNTLSFFLPPHEKANAEKK